MQARRWASAGLAAATAVAMSLVPSIAHAAATTLSVQVGGDSTVSGVAFEGMRFGAPSNMTVHKGDTIVFDFKGFHTATLIPAGVGAEDWRMDNTRPGGPFSLIQPDSDDSPAGFLFNNAVLFPSNPSCGTTSSPCAYDGKSVVNSGAPLASTSFAVTINANPGSSFWVLCLIHSMMQTRISVVADSTSTTTQSQIDSNRSSTLASDRAEAKALIPKLEKQTRHKIAAHRYVTDAYAGFDGDGWGLDGMFPRTLHIKLGQTVRWHFSQLLGNVHTVTFPRRRAVNFSNKDFAGQVIVCEGSSGDTAPDAPPPTFCSSGPQNIEVSLRAIAVTPQGGHRYFGTGLFSSGVRGPDGLTTHFYDLTFKKRSSKTGFKYACGIHGAMMSGAVIVS
jgi:plastocyanin